MTQYLLSVYTPADATPPTPDALNKIMSDLDMVNQELKAAGSWVFGGGLHGPDTATVLQLASGDVVTTDGPFTEGKEYLGGISIIRAADLDEALGWARRIARAITLPIEVRPFVDEPPAGSEG
jgi:hypothetical protein